MNPRISLRGKYLTLSFFFLFGIMGTCSSVQAIKEPEFELKEVRILQIHPEGVSLEGVLEIRNPNESKSRFSGYRYQLEMEGQRVVTGESEQPFEIPALGTTSITIPAEVRFKDLEPLSNQDLFNRDLHYRLTGTVSLDSWIGKLPIPFSYEGSINLSDRLRQNVRDLLEGL
ncbi:MAG: LEA type 2 family protein [Pseudomonadota bacterium]